MAILGANSLEFMSSSVSQTERLGVRLGELLQSGDVVCLTGELGAGKTAFTRGVGRGWGSVVRVTSPTYTIVHVYPRARDQLPLNHVDCYRLRGDLAAADEDDVETTGLMDLLDDPGVTLLEWAERVKPFLPAGHLWLTIQHIDEFRRNFRFDATGERHIELLNEFKKNAFGT